MQLQQFFHIISSYVKNNIPLVWICQRVYLLNCYCCKINDPGKIQL